MVRFVLLSQPRSGSTLVRMSLADHSCVEMFGEIFNDDELIRRKALRTGSRQRRLRGVVEPYQEGDDGARFLRERIFAGVDEGPAAVGFKLFHSQARGDPTAATAWDYLIAEEGIRVVHLVRGNLLDSYVSLQLALLTGTWLRPAGSPEPRRDVPPLELDPGACEEYFEEVSADFARAEHSFRHHLRLDIEYERDLCHDFEAALHRIQDFLEVPRVPPTRPLEKQARRPAREQIANYDALARYFRGSQHERFFG
jgi:LPS sulfotransferase NodH